MFNRYYQDELTFLREMGAEFAAAYPQLAPMLSASGSDPDVERLLEGVAFLTGRIRQKLDDELPELTQSLLSLLWPHYLRPIPAMSIVQFQPIPERMRGKALVPRDTSIQSVEVNGTPCVFRTCYDVELFPFSLEHAELELPMAEAARLRLRFRLAAGASLSKLELSKLRLFLYADSSAAYAIYLWLTRYVGSVSIQPVGGQQNKQGLSLGEPYPSVIKPVGFDESESLLPYPDRSFVGFRLLQEYFCFPRKFLFVDIHQLEAVAAVESEDAFDLVFTFSRTPPDSLRVGPGTFRLFCTPVINLFDADADPIRVRHELTEYRIRPGDPDHNEIFSVERVLTRIQGTGEEIEYPPFFAFKHRPVSSADDRTIYCQMRLREAVGRTGADTYVSFVNVGGLGVPPDAETISIRVVCTNRDLTSELKVGDIRNHHQPFPEFARFTNITNVTPSIRAPLEGDLSWRLISHLSLNYRSLMRLEAFRGILELYNFPALVDAQAARQNQLRLEGITKLQTEHTSILYAGAPVPGIRTELLVDETNFIDDGDVYMFATVLNEFLAMYATFNCTTQLVVRGIRRGEVYEWQPRIGKQIIL